MSFSEHWHRSAIKSISYRTLSISVDTVVAYFFTRQIGVSLLIVGFVNGYSTILYYVHERIWNKVPIGKVARNKNT